MALRQHKSNHLIEIQHKRYIIDSLLFTIKQIRKTKSAICFIVSFRNNFNTKINHKISILNSISQGTVRDCQELSETVRNCQNCHGQSWTVKEQQNDGQEELQLQKSQHITS